MEPRLVGPIIGSLAAALCFWIGRYVIPEEYQVARVLFILVGGVCLFFALAGFLDWAIYKFGDHIRNVRESWYEPYIHLSDNIAMMNPQQLSMLENVGPFRLTGRLVGGDMLFFLWTPGGDIPYDWVYKYLNSCQHIYPELIPQHGLPDSIKRDFIGRFTSLMVMNGFAEPSLGNQSAKWKVPLDFVYEKLRMKEE